jgi:hypothetical protein
VPRLCTCYAGLFLCCPAGTANWWLVLWSRRQRAGFWRRAQPGSCAWHSSSSRWVWSSVVLRFCSRSRGVSQSMPGSRLGSRATRHRAAQLGTRMWLSDGPAVHCLLSADAAAARMTVEIVNAAARLSLHQQAPGCSGGPRRCSAPWYSSTRAQPGLCACPWRSR